MVYEKLDDGTVLTDKAVDALSAQYFIEKAASEHKTSAEIISERVADGEE